ncbi:hypothetical protein C6P40_002394 [Pichia californica]|uniref:Uncharacterized protein n=1 Tax=Pichia californica TaxID=460514 RepID=A0A9P6WJS2_9ASCO|nr:hypothetical protein C6P40_002394 [[Candida] californica]
MKLNQLTKFLTLISSAYAATYKNTSYVPYGSGYFLDNSIYFDLYLPNSGFTGFSIASDVDSDFYGFTFNSNKSFGTYEPSGTLFNLSSDITSTSIDLSSDIDFTSKDISCNISIEGSLSTEKNYYVGLFIVSLEGLPQLIEKRDNQEFTVTITATTTSTETTATATATNSSSAFESPDTTSRNPVSSEITPKATSSISEATTSTYDVTTSISDSTTSTSVDSSITTESSKYSTIISITSTSTSETSEATNSTINAVSTTTESSVFTEASKFSTTTSTTSTTFTNETSETDTNIISSDITTTTTIRGSIFTETSQYSTTICTTSTNENSEVLINTFVTVTTYTSTGIIYTSSSGELHTEYFTAGTSVTIPSEGQPSTTSSYLVTSSFSEFEASAVKINSSTIFTLFTIFVSMMI